MTAVGIEELKSRFDGIKGIELTAQQAEAVTAVDGCTLLLAVPGSGKTTVLVMRLGYMIFCEGIAPRDILTMTYTVAAAADMSRRFAAFFGEENAREVEFRTINGVCAKIIMAFEQRTGRKAFDLLTDEKQQAAIILDILKQTVGGFPGESDRKELQQKITYAKNMMLTEAEIDKMSDRAFPFAKMYRQYNDELKSRRLMDYDDQMVYALQILKSYPAILESVSSKYKYICVDEAQDTSKIQHEIIALIAQKNENLFMVGDEDQSIYGFRAAYPEALLKFGERHKGAKILYMEQNFRSDGNIVEAADLFISRNVFRYKKTMLSSFPAANVIKQKEFLSRLGQYPYICSLARGCDVQTALLYRDNESAIPVIDRLEREGIPYNLRLADASFFSHRVVRDIQDIIAFALDGRNTEIFLRIYYKINTYLRKEIAQEACRLSIRRGIPVLAAVGLVEGATRSACDRANEVLSAFEAVAKARGGEAIGLISYSLGYREYLTRMGINAGKLITLTAIAEKEPTAAAFLERLAVLQELIDSHSNPRGCNFTLSTIHSAKGLEYERVFLCDVCDGTFPESVPYVFTKCKVKGFTKEEEEELKTFEEERRLFYVGMTRAKKELTILTYKNAPSSFSEEIFAPDRLTAGAQSSASSRQEKRGAAQKSHIPTPQEIADFRSTHPVGSVFEHKRAGFLTVTVWSDDFVSVTTASGEKKTYDAALLLGNGLIVQ